MSAAPRPEAREKGGGALISMLMREKGTEKTYTWRMQLRSRTGREAVFCAHSRHAREPEGDAQPKVVHGQVSPSQT